MAFMQSVEAGVKHFFKVSFCHSGVPGHRHGGGVGKKMSYWTQSLMVNYRPYAR